MLNQQLLLLQKPAPAVAPQGARFEKRVKMTRLRKTIANRLVDVQQTSAILTTFNEVDMTAVMDIRKKIQRSIYQGT